MEVFMRTNEAARPTGSSPSILSAILGVAATVTRPLWMLADTLGASHERWKQRQALLSLDDHLLKDIGVSRAQAEDEAGKPFWRE
jgi:uncharacterized protein YjiS (DUF1127 family)